MNNRGIHPAAWAMGFLCGVSLSLAVAYPDEFVPWVIGASAFGISLGFMKDYYDQ